MTEKSKKIGPQNFTLNCELPKTRKEWNDLAGRSSNPSSAYTTDSLVSFMASSACTDLADFRAKAVVPPADGGAKAMLFMLSAFVIEAVMWGFVVSSAGIFTAFYHNHPNFRNNRTLPIVGTLGTGIPFLGAPIITPLTARWHKYQRHMIWTGWILCMASLAAASFSTKVWHLIITQGLGYGLGFLILYYALLSMLNEWFVKRRGFAYGVLFAAAGISGTGLPFLIEILLDKYGYKVTLRGYAIGILVLIGPMLPFCRARLPHSKCKPEKVHCDVLKNPVFYVLSFSNLAQGLAFYLPGLYIPSFSAALGLSTLQATIVLCLLNLAQVIGQIVLGWVSDWTNVFVLIAISSLGSAIPACLLWYLATNMAHMISFGVLFGLFAGGYSVLYARFVSTLTHDPGTGLWLYGLLAFQRGLGNILAGPISAGLIGLAEVYASGVEKYRGLIIFTGVALTVSALGGLGQIWSKSRPSGVPHPVPSKDNV